VLFRHHRLPKVSQDTAHGVSSKGVRALTPADSGLGKQASRSSSRGSEAGQLPERLELMQTVTSPDPCVCLFAARVTLKDEENVVNRGQGLPKGAPRLAIAWGQGSEAAGRAGWQW